MLVQISRTSTPCYLPQKPFFDGCIVYTIVNPATNEEEYFQIYEASESELLFLHKKLNYAILIQEPWPEVKRLGCELNLEIYDDYRE